MKIAWAPSTREENAPRMAFGSEAGSLGLGRMAPTDIRPGTHPPRDPDGSLSEGNGRPPLQRPVGFSTQRCDRFPARRFGHGLTVGGHFIRAARRQLKRPRPSCRKVRAGAQRGEEGRRYQTRGGGVLTLLHSPDPHCCSSSICGRRVLPSEGQGDLAADGSWAMGGALLCGAPLRVTLGTAWRDP